MNKINFYIFCILFLLFKLPSLAQDTYCQYIYGKESAETIFSGEVVKIKTKQVSGLKYMAKFKVDSVYKGQCMKKAYIYTSVNDICREDSHPCELCGFEFEVGKRYVVYVCSKSKGIYETNKCTQTQEIPVGKKVWLKSDISTLEN